MGLLAAFIATSGAIIVAAVTWTFLGHYHRLPSSAHPWICRALIVVMFCAGLALAISPVGTWLTHLFNGITGLFGGLGSGLGHLLIVWGAWALLATLIVGLVWQPNDAVVSMALFLPWVMSLVPSGEMARLFASLSAPALQVVQNVSSWLGG